MGLEVTAYELDGMSVRTLRAGTGAPFVLWPTQAALPTLADEVAEKLVSAGQGDFTLCALLVDDWDAQLSPWKAVGAGRAFAGQGETTLEWITRHLPEIACDDTFLAGYSLAGLFSMWALTQTDAFKGAASASGSLWYPGWSDYLEMAKVPSDAIAYLSVGSKEQNAPDEQMARVVTATQETHRWMKARLGKSMLKMKKGGHFSDPSGRMAAAIGWLLDNA